MGSEQLNVCRRSATRVVRLEGGGQLVEKSADLR